MSAIKFVKPTQEMVRFIASNMRRADALEVYASDGYSPLEALEMSLAHSSYSTVAVSGDTPLVLFGLTITDMLTGAGRPWLLGTNQALKYKSEFLKISPIVVEEMLTICPKLVNYVHAENRVSVRWLKWLGFSVESPEPMGPCGELFHRFTKERKHV